jgi:hypothetical protein
MATRKKKKSSKRARRELTRSELLNLVRLVDAQVTELLKCHREVPPPCEPLRCGLATIKVTIRASGASVHSL